MPPPPQQPQYPYGQQPPQAPPPPGPYGSPYPQQQPYPQQPYPGWGMPPMGPPPKKRRVGLVLGIVGGVLLLLVGGLVALGVIGMKIEAGFPEAKNKLTLPKTLLDQKYDLADDLSDSEGRKIKNEVDGSWDAKVTDSVVGRYSPGGDDTKGTLVVSGLYGRFQNTTKGRNNMLKGVGEADGVTVAEPRRDLTPSGTDTTISCEVVVQKRSSATLTYPVCAWADGNTAAVVVQVDTSALTASSADVDLEAAARDTAKVRAEMLKPIG
ncbi:hypothetical protein [Streptomyces cellostaticus]|nr:hypothetical protein [Streptomyces cellostaticus]